MPRLVDGLIWLDWQLPAGVMACVTTRDASWGVSQGRYGRLNLASHVGDDINAVNSNRGALLQRMPGANGIQWLQQTHSSDVRKACGGQVILPGDAVVSRLPGLACAVLTADCLPVLMTDGQQVAAVHVGWRGLVAGILEKTLQHFVAPQRVSVYLGPAIGPQAFEIGPDVVDQLGVTAQQYITPGQGDRSYADLYGLARQRLQGVASVTGGGYCSVEEARFYSYRKEAMTGRMASLIWLTGSTL